MDFELATPRTAVKGDLTRERIKGCARELFARYGLERVTIRDIAKYAGQRNGGSVNYYFRSKEDLILEILNDAAKEADETRGRMLDQLLSSGEAPTVRAMLNILVSAAGPEDESVRLVITLMNDRRDLMHTTIPGRYDHNYRRCLQVLKPLLPHLPEVLLRQRMYFVIPFLWSFLATREGGEDRPEFWKKFWADPSTSATLFDLAEAMLLQPPSAETQRALEMENSGSFLPS